MWPYFLGNMVELPLTMPQDHTLYEILGHTDLSLWDRKVSWLEQVGGLVLINVHPDYITSAERLQQYEDFLGRMKERARMWHALPKEVARWWRRRDMFTLEIRDGPSVVSGPDSNRAEVVRLTLDPAGYLRFGNST